MKLLYLLFILPSVLGNDGIDRSNLKDSFLCNKWKCLNSKLGISETLPPMSETEETLKGMLPEAWHDVLGKALKYCYGPNSKQYTNTCTGQGFLQCIVVQMNENCPEANLERDAACSPVSTLAGLNYMFWQSRYENFEQNLVHERLPALYLRSYYNTKCCNLPVMFNTAMLQECGFSAFIKYHTQPNHESAPVMAASDSGNTDQMVASNEFDGNSEPVDPIDCCDLSDFVDPAWRSECGFNLTWTENGLFLENQTPVSITEAQTTTTESFPTDVMVLPQSCEKETCVFRSMDIIKDTGAVDVDSYFTMLDNFAKENPAWTSAKARVVTKCVNATNNYEAECEINKMLACTMDVLTENCPHKTKKWNICKHGNQRFSCQISSSKSRPKYRREICPLPELIQQELLSQCGLDSLYRSEHVVRRKPTTRANCNNKCKDATAATTCLMNKLDILDKHSFLDYFKMKDRLSAFTTNKAEWSTQLDVYMSALYNAPIYRGHCRSQRKLLNVVHSMLLTCPVSSRKNTAQCNKIFKSMTDPDNKNHNEHVFSPSLSPYSKIDIMFRGN